MEQAVITNYLGDDTQDPITKITDSVQKGNYFDGTEPGLFNPISSSIIKMRNNGMIDIFVATNQGVRIDPTTNSVNFFTTNEKHHVENITAWVEYNFKVMTKRLIELTSNDMNINITKKLYINADAYKLIANKATLQCKSLNLDVPADNLMLAGKSMAAVNKEMSDTQTLLDTTRKEADQMKQNQQQTNNTINNSIQSLWNAVAAKK